MKDRFDEMPRHLLVRAVLLRCKAQVNVALKWARAERPSERRRTLVNRKSSGVLRGMLRG